MHDCHQYSTLTGTAAAVQVLETCHGKSQPVPCFVYVRPGRCSVRTSPFQIIAGNISASDLLVIAVAPYDEENRKKCNYCGSIIELKTKNIKLFYYLGMKHRNVGRQDLLSFVVEKIMMNSTYVQQYFIMHRDTFFLYNKFDQESK